MTISRALLPALALSALTACAPQTSPGTYGAVTRSVKITIGRRLKLDEPFLAADLATRIDDSTWALHPDEIADPDSLRVEVTPKGRIYALDYIYRDDESFTRLLAKYTLSLGHPMAATARSAEWDDRQTRLQVWWTGADTVGALQARIDDRPRTRGG